MKLRRTLRLSGRALSAALAVSLRRRVHGPRQPHWPWRYEVAMSVVRSSFRRRGTPLPIVRARLDALGARELRRGRATFRATSVGGVACTWVETTGVRSDAVIVYLHGGGYGFGSVRSHATTLVEMARAAGRPVLAVDYRLAPEHPCPAAIHDVLAVLDALTATHAPDRILLAGDSAGGGLSVAALVARRAAGLPPLAGAVLLSPWVDLAVTGESTTAWADDDYLGTQETLREFAQHYLGGRASDDPEASPLYADLHGLPPVLILAGGAEILLDDARRLAERAGAAGVDVTLHVEPGEVHVYPSFVGLSPRARDGWVRVRHFTEARLG